MPFREALDRRVLPPGFRSMWLISGWSEKSLCGLRSGCFVRWKGFVVSCLFPQLLMDLFEFVDTLISFSELEHDFITSDSMLLIPFGELYIEPSNPSPCLFRFLQSHVKSIDIVAVMF